MVGVMTSKVILCTTPHLDWDWIVPFQGLCDNTPKFDINNTTYFSDHGGPAFQIFTQATGLLAPNGKPDPAYVYSICEMGFLRAFTETNPTPASLLKLASSNIEILGGGVTSPDSLLPHGEAFLRNYLVGATWVKLAYGLFPKHAWVPDDFGHDSQLPVMLAAMGLQGVAFWRVPGGAPINLPPLQGLSIAAQLTANGADFLWGARDGSTAVTHWLSSGYNQGGGLALDSAVSDIQGYINANQPVAVTSTIFVPVGDDFSLPNNTAACAAAWNQQSATVTAVPGTFDDYVQELVSSGLLGAAQSFHPQPYYSGCYQTRPRLKRLHYDAARALLGAEIFGMMAGARYAPACGPAWLTELQARTSALRVGWEALAPSTHHDYITGTGTDYVYRGEQLPRLAAACAGAIALRRDAMRDIAAQIRSSPQTGEQPVAVFNQLGFQRSGLVELSLPAALDASAFQSVRTASGGAPLQVSAEGRLLFPANCDSLGYATVYLSPNPVHASDQPTIVTPDDGASYVLANDLISVKISAASNWSIDTINDLASSTPDANVLSAASNTLGFYVDQAGTNYRYSPEQGSDYPPLILNPSVLYTVTGVEVLEKGPLRVRLQAKITCTVAGDDYPYVLEYLLVVGEPFVRMRTTGACPFGYSAMTQFQLSAEVDAIAQGTPYHWDDAPQVRYWQGPSMQATHDFLIPETTTGAPLCAIYHGAMPAWGQGGENSPLLVGGLARNPGNNYFSWCEIPAPPGGIDPDIHTLDYAFRVPTGISTDGTGKADPSDGAQLREALGYNTPLLALVAPAASTGSMPASVSLASVRATSGASQPILTAAKPSEADPGVLILRIYQPSNASMDVSLSLEGLEALCQSLGDKASVVTALEQAIPGGQAASVINGNIAFTAPLAITTLSVPWTP
jgi:alpha-mannosidase